ncbi:electron transfer flavo protein, alpha subunit [Wallemia mellicola]|uniref:Probable electron transfer flavoprotein subunit alpha n=1 Tax=Wallemia mellicola TaxID=1708541 RepID=A0A4T0NAX6_9BASI|nr:electron transfer flavo protein, alpha subunit [Wallemia mellicola]TIC04691.1 electron transfer flavo protein, alpha subunit [Wallemia mellicola]TIC07370.1 electron transfer flavo protein, alpha subunit [Wallemia mellicola]TIC14237.1 electron transfer flavo protein, alpha subunit [Wallemia mellicola]TIC32763.1 electron transfer flavo protein, alpha subunit [Wallemia mellicola]
MTSLITMNIPALRSAFSATSRRTFSTSRTKLDALVYLEHRDGKINPGSLSALTAAQKVDGKVVGLVAGSENVDSVVEEAKKLPVNKLLLAKSDIYNHHSPSTLAPLLKSIVENDSAITHLFAVHSAVGKNVLPRAAALLDTSIIADILNLENGGTEFTRGIYAGNAISTIKSDEPKKVVTVRGTAFDAAVAGSSEVAVEEIAAVDAKDHAPYVSSEMTVTARPDLGSASRVISGGRALKSAENFNQIIEPLADKLGAAIGASRAAVDSGYADNSLQVGQTGKIVAPELYMAIGISGAIQHLAGMKDSKLIVAVNKDPEAPIFQIADVGLVADLFEAVPEITKKIDT